MQRRWAALAALVNAACAPLAELGLDTRPVSIDEPLDDTTRGRLMHATAEPADCARWLGSRACAGRGDRCRRLSPERWQEDHRRQRLERRRARGGVPSPRAR